MTTDHVERLAGLGPAVGLLLGCGASDREAPEPSTLEIAKPAGTSGDGQVGVAGVRLPDSLRVVVTRDEEPVAGVTVIWFTTEGSVNPATVSTGSDGMAATTWTPLPLFAEQFEVARLDGGQAAGFTAIATPDPDAPNTVLVLSEGNRFEPTTRNLRPSPERRPTGRHGTSSGSPRRESIAITARPTEARMASECRAPSRWTRWWATR